MSGLRNRREFQGLNHNTIPMRASEWLSMGLSNSGRDNCLSITISMSASDSLSVGLSDSRTDSICQTEEPEKVPSTELQYDIDRCYNIMFSWTDKGSNTKSLGSGTRENSREWITLGYWWAHRNNYLSVHRTQEHTGFEALNRLVQEAERIPSTKSHYNMDRRVWNDLLFVCQTKEQTGI